MPAIVEFGYLTQNESQAQGQGAPELDVISRKSFVGWCTEVPARFR